MKAIIYLQYVKNWRFGRFWHIPRIFKEFKIYSIYLVIVAFYKLLMLFGTGKLQFLTMKNKCRIEDLFY
jgi:hypothetical protein